MGANNTSQFFDNLSDSLGNSFNPEDLSRANDCSMSEKAILYAEDELGADEIHEFTAHLHQCRFCVDLILDLRMAEQESRESAGQAVEVLPALAEAVVDSTRIEPAHGLIEKIGVVISKVRSFLFLPKLLVPLATACLIFIVVQSGLKDSDSARQHEVLRNRIGTPKPEIVPPPEPPGTGPNREVPQKSVPSEKHDKSKPPETLYSMAPSLKEKPESFPVAKKRKKRMPRSPLARLNLSQLKLVGIVRLPDGNKAIVEDHSGKGHVLEVGSTIGKNNGRVIRIQRDSVIIAEEIMHESGEIKVKEIILKLRTSISTSSH